MKIGNYPVRNKIIAAIMYAKEQKGYDKLIFSRERLAEAIGCSRSTIFSNLSYLLDSGLAELLPCKSYRITDLGASVYHEQIKGSDHDIEMCSSFSKVHKPKRANESEEQLRDRVKNLGKDSSMADIPYVDLSVMNKWNIDLHDGHSISLGELLTSVEAKRYIYLICMQQKGRWAQIKESISVAYYNQVHKTGIRNLAVFVSKTLQEVFKAKKWFISKMRVFFGKEDEKKRNPFSINHWVRETFKKIKKKNPEVEKKKSYDIALKEVSQDIQSDLISSKDMQGASAFLQSIKLDPVKKLLIYQLFNGSDMDEFLDRYSVSLNYYVNKLNSKISKATNSISGFKAGISLE